MTDTSPSNNSDNAARTRPKPDMTTTVILLCGLPASGKSTLAKQLKEYYNNVEHDLKFAEVIHLEYDAFEDHIVSQQQQQQLHQQEQQQLHRQEEEERREAWNQARQVAMQDLEEQLIKQPQNRQRSLLIFMDDNFHLRGMRKQIHRLLLRHTTKPCGRPLMHFGLIWMQASVEICLERNRHRSLSRKIPEQVIAKMHSSMEPPRAAWEQYWISVQVETTDSTTTPLQQVVNFVQNCAEIVDPLSDANTVDPQQQAIDRAKTLQNQRHGWDKLLRSWVGIVAKQDKRLARGANGARKELLLRTKDNACDISEDEQLLQAFLDLVLSSDYGRSASAPSASLRPAIEKLLLETLL